MAGAPGKGPEPWGPGDATFPSARLPGRIVPGRPARRVGGSRAPVAQAAPWKEASWTRPAGHRPALLRGESLSEEGVSSALTAQPREGAGGTRVGAKPCEARRGPWGRWEGWVLGIPREAAGDALGDRRRRTGSRGPGAQPAPGPAACSLESQDPALSPGLSRGQEKETPQLPTSS